MLKFYHSTMGGGKSAILIAKASLNPRNSVAFKPAIDTRDGVDVISSRNGSSTTCFSIRTTGFSDTYAFLFRSMRDMGITRDTVQRFIFIDEAQFLNEKQVNAILKFSLDYDIIVECYGLLVDFKSKLFEGSKRLIEVADLVECITAYGTDGEVAKQNARIIDGEIQFEGEQVLLGKEESYKALSNHKYFIDGGFFND